MSGERLFVAQVNENRCVDCGFCRGTLYCPSPQGCIGCGACVEGCRFRAREMVVDDRSRTAVNIMMDGEPLSVPEQITVKRAMELAGFT